VQACGLSAAFSAGQPLAWLGAVPEGRGASRAGRVGVRADPSTGWRGGRWKKPF